MTSRVSLLVVLLGLVALSAAVDVSLARRKPAHTPSKHSALDSVPPPPPPMDMPRFAEVGLGAAASPSINDRLSTLDTDLPRNIFNLLAVSRDANVADSSSLQQMEVELDKRRAELEEHGKLLEQRQAVLNRVEICLQAVNGTDPTVPSATGARRDDAKLEAERARLAEWEKVLQAWNETLNQREKDLREREARLAAAWKQFEEAQLRWERERNKPRPEPPVQKPAKPTTGNGVCPGSCEALNSCGECTANGACGWCRATKQCMPLFAGLHQCGEENFDMMYCKQARCNQHVSCRSCMADPRCGQCMDTGMCMEGGIRGPSQGSCNDWSYAHQQGAFNFLSLNAYTRDTTNMTNRAAEIGRVIRQANADFVALQEVEDWFLAALNEQSWSANYHFSDFGSGHAPGGLVILSKVPLDYVAYVEKTQPGQVEVDQRGRLLVVKPRIGRANFAVANTHLDWRSGDSRADALEFVFSNLNTTTDVVLMGDFNFDDRSMPETGRIPVSYDDVWEQLNPRKPGYTWDPQANSYARSSDPSSRPSRIDRIFVKSEFCNPRAIQLVGNGNASPHFGLLAKIDLYGAYC